MTGYARSVDANQGEIIEALAKVGASIQTLQLEARGAPDLLVGYRGRNYLIEVKTARGKLNHRQRLFFDAWRGQAAVVHSVAEALAVLGIKIETQSRGGSPPPGNYIDPISAHSAQLHARWSDLTSKRG